MNRRHCLLLASLWPLGHSWASTHPPSVSLSFPASRALAFQVQGQAKGIPYRAEAELVWTLEGARYHARQTVRAFLLGERTQRSEGQVTPQGLVPERFADERRGKVRGATFTPQGVTFSAGTPAAPWQDGLQDRLSVFVQLGARLAALKEPPASGTTFTLPTAGVQDVEPWTFVVQGHETLTLTAGSMQAVRLERQPRKPRDQKAEIWLAPALDHLPARIRLVEADGDKVDLRLASHQP